MRVLHRFGLASRLVALDHAGGEQGEQREHDDQVHPGAALAVWFCGLADDAADAAQECAGRYVPLTDTAALLFERGRCPGVMQAVLADVDHQIVAAVFALGADLARYPPDGRVIEQERFDGRLNQVDQVIVPANVGQLVRQNRFELLWREAGQRAGRQQDHRFEMPDDRGDVHADRLHEPDSPTDAEPRGQPLQLGYQLITDRLRAGGAEEANRQSAAQLSQGQQHGAGEPERHQPGQRGLERCAQPIPPRTCGQGGHN